MFLRICLCFITVSFSCNVSKPSNNTLNKTITVIGTALDDKGYAVVIIDTPYGRKYFLDGLEEWRKNIMEKKLK